jgi:hypothetical protein
VKGEESRRRRSGKSISTLDSFIQPEANRKKEAPDFSQSSRRLEETPLMEARH